MCKLNLRRWVKIGTDRVKERRGDSEEERERVRGGRVRERCNPASCTLYDWSDHTRWTPNYLLFLSQHLCRSNKSSYHFISPLPFGLFQFVVSSFQPMNICLQLCVLFLRLLFYLTLCFFYRFVFLLWGERTSHVVPPALFTAPIIVMRGQRNLASKCFFANTDTPTDFGRLFFTRS